MSQHGGHSHRSTIIGKLFAAVIMSFFVLYVLPNFKFGLFSLVVLFLGVAIIADTFGKYFSGESSWHILVPSALVVIVLGLLFTLGPGGY